MIWLSQFGSQRSTINFDAIKILCEGVKKCQQDSSSTLDDFISEDDIKKVKKLLPLSDVVACRGISEKLTKDIFMELLHSTNEERKFNNKIFKYADSDDEMTENESMELCIETLNMFKNILTFLIHHFKEKESFNIDEMFNVYLSNSDKFIPIEVSVSPN